MARKSTSQEKSKTGRDEINNRLHEAIEGLRKDVTRVEIWATALSSFTQAVPDYIPAGNSSSGREATHRKSQNEASAKAGTGDKSR